MGVKIEHLLFHKDERGSVLEPLNPEHLPDQRNVHVVITQSGCVRGNHYHRQGTEILTVYGPALIRIRDDETINDTLISAGEAVRFTIPPGVSHAIKNIGEQPNISIAFNTTVHNPAEPDVVRDVLLEN